MLSKHEALHTGGKRRICPVGSQTGQQAVIVEFDWRSELSGTSSRLEWMSLGEGFLEEVVSGLSSEHLHDSESLLKFCAPNVYFASL